MQIKLNEVTKNENPPQIESPFKDFDFHNGVTTALLKTVSHARELTN